MQVFVNRVTLPDDLDGLRDQVRRDALGAGVAQGMSDIWELTGSESLGWSVPRHAMVNDIILFQVSANAAAKAKRLKPLVDALPGEDPDWLGMDAAITLAQPFAGCIIAMGRIDGPVMLGAVGGHWDSRFYAHVADIHAVAEPVRLVGRHPYSEWPEFAAHGPVQYRQFSSDERYHQLLAALETNERWPVPGWAKKATVTTLDLGPVDRSNWMAYARRADVGYPTEATVDHMFSDWLLRELSDRRVLYSEVEVRTEGSRGRVDNVILLGGVPVPVEVKIRAATEPDLFEQLDRYRRADQLRTGKRSLPARNHDVVLVVDQEGVYITTGETQDLAAPALRRRDVSDDSIEGLRRQLRDVVAKRRREETM